MTTEDDMTLDPESSRGNGPMFQDIVRSVLTEDSRKNTVESRGALGSAPSGILRVRWRSSLK